MRCHDVVSMSKAEKLVSAWRSGKRSDVREAEMVVVLREHGFELRRDQGNHWLAEHPDLGDHPQFGLTGGKVGRIKINVRHALGSAGTVHPLAVRDVLGALEHLERKKSDEGKD
jgi:hypothetical protein